MICSSINKLVVEIQSLLISDKNISQKEKDNDINNNNIK